MIKRLSAIIILIFLILAFFWPEIFLKSFIFWLAAILICGLFFWELNLAEKSGLIIAVIILGLFLSWIFANPFGWLGRLFLPGQIFLEILIIFLFILIVIIFWLWLLRKYHQRQISPTKNRMIIFAPYFWPHRGGLEQYSWELASRSCQAGWQVIVVSPLLAREKDCQKRAGFQIIRLDSWNSLAGRWPIIKPNLANFRKFWKLFRSQADVIITQTRFFPMSFWGMFLAIMKQVCHLHIEHGTSYPQLESPLKKILAILYDQIFGAIVISHAQKVLGVSQAAIDFARKLGAQKTAIIYNSIDMKNFRRTDRSLRRKLKLKNKLIIIFVGRLIEGKGVQDLICVFKNLKRRYSRLALLIIGDGFYRRKLVKLSQKEKDIIFLGEKSPVEVARLLPAADIFVNPSYAEGLPTSVLEAGVAGLPVVATDVGGTREIITNGQNGFLIPAKNQPQLQLRIEKLIKSGILRRKFGLALKARVQRKFDWAKTIIKFLNEIKQCVK